MHNMDAGSCLSAPTPWAPRPPYDTDGRAPLPPRPGPALPPWDDGAAPLYRQGCQNLQIFILNFEYCKNPYKPVFLLINRL